MKPGCKTAHQIIGSIAFISLVYRTANILYVRARWADWQSILLERSAVIDVARREFKDESIDVARCEGFSDLLFVRSPLVRPNIGYRFAAFFCCAPLFF